MARVRRHVEHRARLVIEQVGTKHDTVEPCALCTALLAEGVTGEGWPTGSILDTPELAELLQLHHQELRARASSDYAGTSIYGPRGE